MDLSSKKSNHVSKLVNNVAALLDAIGDLQAIQLEATQFGYVAGGENALVDGDFTGANVYMDAAVYNAAVATLSGLNAALAAAGQGGAPSTYAILFALKP